MFAFFVEESNTYGVLLNTNFCMFFALVATHGEISVMGFYTYVSYYFLNSDSPVVVSFYMIMYVVLVF